jgi:hypothetical protein
MRNILPLTLLVLITVASPGALAWDADRKFETLVRAFVPEYKQLKIAELSLSYVDNFKNIQDLAGLSRQRAFFQKYASSLRAVDRSQLRSEMRYQYDALRHQIALDFERLSLEQHYKEHEPASIAPGGILQLPNGKQWYRYYVKKWAADLSPESLQAFGLSEIRRIRRQMEAIQNRLGYTGKEEAFYRHLNGPDFQFTDEPKLLQALREFRALILSNLGVAFESTNFPPVDIQPIPNPTKDSPPGYYDNGVFYYNFYGHHFPARSLEWLFIHEAVPGHHYQGSVSTAAWPTQALFWYPGFTEGWGAYAENLGWELGGYQDPYLAYGKWEWDLVRSARVVMDVGINYLGWTKPTALKFWKANVPNQDAIAEREVDRMFRWPAQVLAYKVGEREILRLRKKFLAARGDLRRFHTLVLERGSIPLAVLGEVIADNLPPSSRYIQKYALPFQKPGALPDQILREIKRYKIISVGEIHGTKEVPELALSLVRLLATTGKSILVGLEIPASEQVALDAFLKSGDIALLKAAPFFRRAYQDGRSSQAMATFLDGMRSFRNAKVVGFDATHASGGQDRDEKMAINLTKAYEAAPTDYVLFLTGNIHGSISIGTPFDPTYRPMGYQLIHQPGALFAERDFLSIKARNETGESWCCLGASVSDCKVHPMNFGVTNYSQAISADFYFLKEANLFEGYKATLFTRQTTASLPLR